MKQTTLKLLATGAVFALSGTAANATIVTSANKSDFILTAEAFSTRTPTISSLVSTSGNISLDIAKVGMPATTAHAYGSFSGTMPGTEYQLYGDENFNINFSSLQSSFALNYIDTSIDSIFTLTFFDGENNVGTTTFNTFAPFEVTTFIGFKSDVNFNKILVRETDAGNSNEFFQFYSASTANSIPEPGSIALAALALLGAALSQRKRNT